jgi:hypothetical protein
MTFTPAAVTPGATCSVAAAIVLGTPYTFDQPGGLVNHWFKFDATNAVQYHVVLVKNSGAGSIGGELSQAPCGTAPFAFFNSLTTCNAWTQSGGNTVHIVVRPSLFGSYNYTLTADTGPCP